VTRRVTQEDIQDLDEKESKTSTWGIGCLRPGFPVPIKHHRSPRHVRARPEMLLALLLAEKKLSDVFACFKRHRILDSARTYLDDTWCGSPIHPTILVAECKPLLMVLMIKDFMPYDACFSFLAFPQA
jgi:hypothetical protein